MCHVVTWSVEQTWRLLHKGYRQTEKNDFSISIVVQKFHRIRQSLYGKTDTLSYWRSSGLRWRQYGLCYGSTHRDKSPLVSLFLTHRFMEELFHSRANGTTSHVARERRRRPSVLRFLCLRGDFAIHVVKQKVFAIKLKEIWMHFTPFTST